jgi:hypothetical protein
MKKSILSLIQDMLSYKKTSINQKSNNGDNSIEHCDIANNMDKSITHNFNITVTSQKQLEEVYESVIRPNSSIYLREAILPIEALIGQGKHKLAIQKYEELINTTSFPAYSKDEKFSVYIGLLNCHINAASSPETIDKWATKIMALGNEVSEIHRYYFLMGILAYGKQNYEKALIYLGQSINAKPDYLNAITSEILLKVSMGQMTYGEAIEVFDSLLSQKGLSVKDYSTIHASYGDTAFNSKDYITAMNQYQKSNKLKPSLSKDIRIATCQYFCSFEVIKEDGRVDFNKIDFESINKTDEMFSKIYLSSNEDTIDTIVKQAFPIYIDVLSLKGEHERILKIYNEHGQEIKNSQTELINFIVEAQILNGILDQELLLKLDEYSQIKYEAFYYERGNEYEKVVELLTPILETQYKTEKVLILTFLTALKGLKNFDKYMHYYQKFSAQDNEVLRMNYIQLLHENDRIDEAIYESKELLKIAENGFVLYDLMFILIKNNLNDELDSFFDKVYSGELKINGTNKSPVYFQMMIHLANNKRYEEYFNHFEKDNLSFLEERHRLILNINYYLFKNDLNNLAIAYYEYFKISNNHDDLMKAVQAKLQINKYHDAEFYLSLVEPMTLERPEYYYMFQVVILKEKNQLTKAFEVLNEVLETIEIDLESPFHQFYVAFNMNNGRTDEAVIYMNEYYMKNPNPYFFKVIQHSENASGEELKMLLEEAVGGKRDLTQFNRYFSQGIIGISVYNNMVGTGIEEMIFMKNYPFTRKQISRGSIHNFESKLEQIGNKLIVDSTTLIILASSDALDLLNIFDELIVPLSTVATLTENKAGTFSRLTNCALDYLCSSPRVKKIPVDEAIRSKKNPDEVLKDDTFDCIILSSNRMTPFLNTEVMISHYNQQNQIIDINALFFFIKEIYPKLKDRVAITIAKMREIGYNFLSFDSEDMFAVFLAKGIDGIDSFLYMGKNADYKTFSFVYTSFLKLVFDNCSEEDFDKCSIKIISFLDKYLGKTRYYSNQLIREFPKIEERMLTVIHSPSTSKIMTLKASLEVLVDDSEINGVTESQYFKKITDIVSAFMIFGIQYIAIGNQSPKTKEKCISLLKSNIYFNNESDIKIILHYSEVIDNMEKRQP